MSAGIAPIYVATPADEWASSNACTAANTNADLSSGTSYLVGTAGVNGAFLKGLTCKALPANATAASVMRIWLNNGSTIAAPANSALVGELPLPATTVQAAGGNPDFYWAAPNGGRAIATGHKVYVTFGTAAGGSGAWCVTADKGDF